MTTRYTSQSATRFNVPGIPSGYNSKSMSDFTIPSVGIEDVDKSLFELFNSEIPLIVAGEGTDMKRVPVIFFAGEKWALNKKLRALRDRNGSLILPLCTAVRTSVTQDSASDITGRGINQQTGEIVIHRRLDKSDRGYQGLINQLLLKHQQNVAVSPNMADPGQLSTIRDVGDLSNDPIIQQGGLLMPNRKNNIYETIVIPSPQFFTAQYDVTLWTQYTTHMNQLIEQLIASQLSQGNVWKLNTPKGYWFLANVESNSYAADTNTDDYSQTERLIRYKFVVKVPGYIFATSAPSAPVPIKRYVSSPTISFDTGIATSTIDESAGVNDPFLGADDPTLPLTSGDDDTKNRRVDQRRHNDTRLYPNVETVNIDDPALKSFPRGTSPSQFKKIVGVDKNGNQVIKYLRVKGTNNVQGETILSSAEGLSGLSIVVTED